MKHSGWIVGMVAALVAPPADARVRSPDMALANAPAHAPAGAEVIPLYGEATMGDPAESVETDFGGGQAIVRNVSYPTLTPVFPVSGRENGIAVIVAPGGGFRFLSLQNEGWRVAQGLADAGYTAFVLQYRVRPTPESDEEFFRSLREVLPSSRQDGEPRRAVAYQPAVEDAQAAIALVRDRASDWNLDSSRVGMIGFSAGAMAAMNASLQADADAGPDFIGYVYGPMDAVEVPANAQPLFAAIAIDDPLFDTTAFPLVSAWQEARRPVELHVYGGGRHGFGLGVPGTTSTGLLPQFIAWLAMLGHDRRQN